MAHVDGHHDHHQGQPQLKLQAQRLYTVTADQRVHILVDRLWPRGVRRDDPRIDHWLPQVAPSARLRQWYAHDVDKFDQFVTDYRKELETEEGSKAVSELAQLIAEQPASLLTAARDLDHSQAVVLVAVLGR